MKRKDIKTMYQDSGYHKEFIALFSLIIITLMIEMITIPYIVRKILNEEIPRKKHKSSYDIRNILYIDSSVSVLYGAQTL